MPDVQLAKPSSAHDDWVRKVLGVDVTKSSSHAGPTVSLVKLGRARIEWRDTLASARPEMAALEKALNKRYGAIDDPSGLLPAALASWAPAWPSSTTAWPSSLMQC